MPSSHLEHTYEYAPHGAEQSTESTESVVAVLPEVHWPAVDADGEVHVVVDVLEEGEVDGVGLVEELGLRGDLHPGEDLVNGVVDLRIKEDDKSVSRCRIGAVVVVRFSIMEY